MNLRMHRMDRRSPIQTCSIRIVTVKKQGGIGGKHIATVSGDCLITEQSQCRQEDGLRPEPNRSSCRTDFESIEVNVRPVTTWFQQQLESMSELDFADPDRFRLRAGQLEISKRECARILDHLGYVLPEEHRAFIAESKKSYRDRWCPIGDDLVQKIICTKGYTEDLLDPAAIGGLLEFRSRG